MLSTLSRGCSNATNQPSDTRRRRSAGSAPDAPRGPRSASCRLSRAPPRAEPDTRWRAQRDGPRAPAELRRSTLTVQAPPVNDSAGFDAHGWRQRFTSRILQLYMRVFAQGGRGPAVCCICLASRPGIVRRRCGSCLGSSDERLRAESCPTENRAGGLLPSLLRLQEFPLRSERSATSALAFHV